MSTKEMLREALERQPEEVLREVWHYLKFVESRHEEEAWSDVLPSREVEEEVLKIAEPSFRIVVTNRSGRNGVGTT